MPSDPTYFYLTVANYRTQTLVPTLIPTTEDEVKEIILEGMAHIDAYIGDGWARYEDDQEFIFPRDVDEEDDTPFIPRNVSLATRIVCDAIVKRRNSGVLPHEVASEGNLGHSYTKTQRQKREAGFEWIPDEAVSLLKKLRRVGGVLALDEYDS